MGLGEENEKSEGGERTSYSYNEGRTRGVLLKGRRGEELQGLWPGGWAFWESRNAGALKCSVSQGEESQGHLGEKQGETEDAETMKTGEC